MKYLHTMVRVTDLAASLRFYCDALGLREIRRKENEKGRFTLVFLAAPGDDDAQVELTYNWDPENYGIGRAFGHLAYAGRRHLRDVPAARRARRDDQPAAARRAHGLRALARPDLGRAAAEGRGVAAARALGVDAEQRRMVSVPRYFVGHLRSRSSSAARSH